MDGWGAETGVLLEWRVSGSHWGHALIGPAQIRRHNTEGVHVHALTLLTCKMRINMYSACDDVCVIDEYKAFQY